MGNLQELSDLKNTVQISARRFEESPYIERTYCPGMIRDVYAGRYFPMTIGEDSIKKYLPYKNLLSKYESKFSWLNSNI